MIDGLKIVTILEYTTTLCSILCLPVNIIFLIMLYKRNNQPSLSSSFFVLCRHLTVADILMMLYSTILFKFPIYGWIPSDFVWELKDWSVLPVLGVQYFGHAQAMGIIGIALNRFTAVYSPIKHRDFWWKKSHINLLLFLQWVLPLFCILPLFFAEFKVVLNSHTGGVLFYASDHTFHRVYFLGMSVLDGGIINAFVSVLYGSIFYHIKMHVTVKKPHEIALRLASSGFLIFLCYLALGIFSLLSALAPPTDPWMYRTIWFIVNDVLCSTNAPILLALNKPIRTEFFKVIGSRNKKNVKRKENLLIEHV
uniref:G_PROTEIN_RECEP_F1_2 domain-containing protein n=1 Tax=Strongyloides stercoralis TaxID=6248 RepID=A0A0K0E360_STRER